MGWADAFAFIGGAAQGAGNALQQKNEYDIAEKKIASDADIKKLQEDIKVQLQSMKGDQAKSLEELKQTGRETLQSLIESGATSLETLKQGGAQEVERLKTTGALSVEDARAVSRLNLQHEINAGTLAVAKTNANASMSNAQTAASASVLNNNNDNAESARQFDLSMPLKEFGADTARITSQRPTSTNPFIIQGTPGAGTTPGAGVTPPTFGPSYGDFMKSRSGYGPQPRPAAPGPVATQPPPGTTMGTPDVIPASGPRPNAPVTPAGGPVAQPQAAAPAMSPELMQAASALQAANNAAKTAKTPAARQKALAEVARLKLAVERLRQPAAPTQ